jgi:hypothetical protein
MKSTRQVGAKNLIAFLDEYGLRKKIVAYVKNGGGKLECNDNGIKIYG